MTCAACRTLPSGWASNSTGDFVLVATAGTTAGPVDLCVHATVGGCVLTSCLNVMVIGSNSVPHAQEGGSISVHPDPSRGLFIFEGTPGSAWSVEVRDGLGRTVRPSLLLNTMRPASLDLSDLAPGAYFLCATGHGQQRILRLLVEH